MFLNSNSILASILIDVCSINPSCALTLVKCARQLKFAQIMCK